MVKNVLEIMENKIAAIMPTLNCNIKCEHCIMSCSPGAGFTMTIEQIEDIVCQFVELQFNPICLTGGEPFLYPDLIKRTSELCLQNNKALVIQTNGFWAKTLDSAIAMLEKIPYITQLGFSIDNAHMKFIGRDTIENGIKAAYEKRIYNISLSISYQTEKERKDISDYFTLRYPKVEIASWPITPLGRAKDNNKLLYTYDKYHLDCLPTGCEVQRDFSPIVTPDGDFHLCYHLLMLLGKDDPFYMGNLLDKRLSDILKELNDPLFSFIMAYGGGSLGYLLEDLAPDLLNKKYQRTCEFCYEVLSNKDLADKIREVLSYEAFTERISEVLSNNVEDNKPYNYRETLLVCDGKNCLNQEKSKHLKYFLTNKLVSTKKYDRINIKCIKCFNECEKGPNIMVESTKEMIHFVDTEKINALINSL